MSTRISKVVHPTKVTTSKKSKEELAEIRRKNGAKAKETNQKGSVYPKSEPMVVSTSLADLEADIYDPRCKVAPELKIHAAACFVATGTVQGAERLTGLTHQQISEWKNKSVWWDTVVGKIRQEKQDLLDAEVTSLIHDVTASLKTRLDEGDYVLHKGELIPKPVSARDLAAILNILYDKRAMLRGDPSRIIRQESSTDIMNQLRAEFTSFAKEALDAKIVSEQ